MHTRRWRILAALVLFGIADVSEIAIFTTIHRRFPAGLTAADVRSATALVAPFWVAVAVSAIAMLWLIAEVALYLRGRQGAR